MLATGHALSGVLSGMGTAPVFGLIPTDRSYWLYVGTHAGAALLPDIDMRGTTADQIWGPLTSGIRVRVLGKRWTVVPGLWSFVRPLVGGHRRGTHATIGLLTVLVLVWLSQLWSPAAGFFVALATGLGIRAVFLVLGHLFDVRYRRRYWKYNLAASVAAGVFFVRSGADFASWLPWGLAGGSAAHVLGDLITDGKVRLDWPFKDEPVGLPRWLAIRAGGWAEHFVVMPLLVIGSGLVLAYQLGADPIGGMMTLMRKIG